MNMADLPMIAHSLRDLIDAIDALPTKITHATASSRDVRPGSIFLAYPGATHDGRNFIGDAAARGAAAVLVEYDESGQQFVCDLDAPIILVKGLKAFASGVGAHVNQYPANELWMIGVTGTNGKTSVSQWVAHALEGIGRRAAVMGTIGTGLVGALNESDNTTPDGLVIQHALREFAEAGAMACAMEVSSHGLDQGRVAQVKFDIAVFTNLTRDHLDYHGSMEQYGEAKAKLFACEGLKAAVINMDDALGRDLVNRVGARNIEVIRYSAGNGMGAAELTADNIAVTSAGLSFDVNWLGGSQGLGRFADMPRTRIQTHILGAFNVSNLLAVIGVLMASGIKLSVAAQVIGHLQPVAGRMQTVRPLAGAAATPLVVVDYAHTPDALEKALATIATIVPDKGRLISVFGCGGDRDRGKRPLMGTISAQYADFTIVTSDNPRTENPQQILLEIAQGVGQAPHKLMDDRKLAIVDAINMAGIHDVVLIAGKGHEEYQILGSTKIHFSDVEVAAVALANWQGGAI